MVNYSGLAARCGHSFFPSESHFATVFTGQEVRCTTCHAPIDVWGSVYDCFVAAGATFNLLAPLRGSVLLSTVILTAGELYDLNLSDLGIAPTASVRGLNLTGTGAISNGGYIFPAQLTGNEVRIARLPHEYAIYGAAVGTNPPKTTSFNLYVQYIDVPESIHRRILLEAVYAHGDNDFRRAIIDAHTATDTALDRILTVRIGSLTRDSMRMGFMEKVRVMSGLRQTAGLDPLPEKVTNALSELNTQRNKVAHPPKRNEVDLTQTKTAELLTAALCVIELTESQQAL